MSDFETKLSRLEKLAEQIRQQDLPIESAMAVFEEGILLAKNLENDLAGMQGKVEMLLSGTADPESNPVFSVLKDSAGKSDFVDIE